MTMPSQFRATTSDEGMPVGSLKYGAQGSWHVWEQTDSGRIRWSFDDEDLAMQAAVRLGGAVAEGGMGRSYTPGI